MKSRRRSTTSLRCRTRPPPRFMERRGQQHVQREVVSGGCVGRVLGESARDSTMSVNSISHQRARKL
eukprot:1177709-Pyramimonas_sp.AAC.2